MRVLLVEDDPATSRSIEMMLTSANLNVYATDLGEEGIDLAKLYDYDIILLDLSLPDMHGLEVLRQLRVAKIETPILILSGSDDSDSKLKGFGFSIAIYPSAGMGAACSAIERSFSYLKENQTLENCPVPAYDMKQLHELVGFQDVWDFEKRHVETK